MDQFPRLHANAQLVAADWVVGEHPDVVMFRGKTLLTGLDCYLGSVSTLVQVGELLVARAGKKLHFRPLSHLSQSLWQAWDRVRVQ